MDFFFTNERWESNFIHLLGSSFAYTIWWKGSIILIYLFVSIIKYLVGMALQYSFWILYSILLWLHLYTVAQYVYISCSTSLNFTLPQLFEDKYHTLTYDL